MSKLFMCYLSLGIKRRDINKIFRKSEQNAGTVPEQSREKVLDVFSSLRFLSSHIGFPSPALCVWASKYLLNMEKDFSHQRDPSVVVLPAQPAHRP